MWWVPCSCRSFCAEKEGTGVKWSAAWLGPGFPSLKCRSVYGVQCRCKLPVPLCLLFFSLLGASSSVAPFFQYDFQGAHVAICEQSLVTHYMKSLTGEPRFPVPMCHLTGWISTLRGGQWSLFATKGRQLCGTLCIRGPEQEPFWSG